MDDINAFLSELFDYYNKDVRSGSARIYKRMLKNIPVETLYRMFEKHLMDPDRGQFMPKVADFVRGEQGTAKGNAVAAWDKIIQAMELKGPYYTITKDDPWLLKSLEEVGGYQKLCEMTYKDLEYKRNDFLRAYESNRARGMPENYPAKIKGLIDLENGTDSDPILIGDERLALNVLKNGSTQKTLQITEPKDYKHLLLEHKHEDT